MAVLLAVAAMVALPPLSQAAGPQPPVLWDAKERIAKPDLSDLPRLRFLTTTDFPPFNYLDRDGRLSGFHVDLARAICAALSAAERCQIQAVPWAELEPALRGGQAEAILAGLAITPESRQRLGFSRPYLRFPARFVSLKSRGFGEPVIETIAGKRIGVLAGSAHEAMLRAFFPQARPVTYARADWMLADLKEAKVDAAFGDGMRLAFWLTGTDAANCCSFAGGPYLSEQYLGAGMAIATRPEDARLTAAFDAALQQISANGVFTELYLRHFPTSFY